MKALKDILYKVSLTSSTGDMELGVKDIVFDSRQVTEGSAFVAIKGTQVDGHEFIDKAIGLGAESIVCELLPEKLIEGITYVEVVNSARALGIMASNYFDNPSENIKVVAITGTN